MGITLAEAIQLLGCSDGIARIDRAGRERALAEHTATQRVHRLEELLNGARTRAVQEQDTAVTG